MGKQKSWKHWRDMRDGVDYIYTPAKNRDALVDICMLTYNHAPYIRHAIESVLMQETRHPYRLIIGDDCSTDGTEQIVREYQEKYPGQIATIFWKYNTGFHGPKCNGLILSRHCTANYVASLEGDDYWTSPHKLEKAISFLEEHPEYVAYAHNINYVDENEKMLHLNTKHYCVREEHIFTKQNAMKLQLVTQTAAVVQRNYTKSWTDEVWDAFAQCQTNGDEKRSMILGILGDVYFDRAIMADHRKVYHGDSWTARTTERNIALYYYNGIRNKAKFAKELFGVEIPLEPLLKRRVVASREAVLRQLSYKNISICLQITMREFWRKLEERFSQPQ